MQEEIFGPILPVLTFENLDEAETFITDRPTPLALYIFSQDREVQQRFVRYVPLAAAVLTTPSCIWLRAIWLWRHGRERHGAVPWPRELRCV